MSKVNKSLIVLTEMDSWSASTRYRALQYLPYFRQYFSDVNLSLPGDTVTRRPGRAGQIAYFGTHAARYARRGAGVQRQVRTADTLFVQRGLYPIGPGLIIKSLNRFSGRLVFDLDDAVFRLSPKLAEKSAAARWLYGPQQALDLLHRADSIVVSTPTLAELLPPGTVAPVILPTVPDPAMFMPQKHRDKGPVTVGWAGTVGGLSYLDPLADVFRRLQREEIAELEVICSVPWSGPGRFHQWKLSEEVTLFQRFDIGIMPLPLTDYTRAKAGFKLLQYMAAGLPVVASPLGVNRDLVERSGGGLLAESPQEWEEAIRQLAADVDLRSSLGAAGRTFVEDYANLAAKANVLNSLLDEAASPIKHA